MYGLYSRAASNQEQLMMARVRYFIILLLDKKLSKSIVKIAPDVNKYLKNIFTILGELETPKFSFEIN